MTRRLKALVAIAFAFVVLSAGDCDFSSLGDILDEPGQIVVSNTGTEVAIVAISAEDVKSYPTIAGGGTGSAQTNVGGAYTVSVTMTQQQTLEYGDDLLNLRRTVERLVDGSATSEEKVYAFTKLAGIKAALAQLNSGSGASCSGNIKLKPDDAVTVNATVEWVTQSGTGFWNLNCGSSD